MSITPKVTFLYFNIRDSETFKLLLQKKSIKPLAVHLNIRKFTTLLNLYKQGFDTPISICRH